ncbi:MAG: hypothetical protein ACPG7F_21775, partial [Aggregatilineales bacterium]
YQTSEHRIQDLCVSLRRWEDAYVQMEQIDERIAEALVAEKQMQDEFAAKKEKCAGTGKNGRNHYRYQSERDKMPEYC